MNRRQLLCTALPLVLPLAAHAAWPEKPVRIVVPTNPGSPPDVAVRALSDLLSANLGQPVVVENRAGAMGIIGMEAVANASGDGYTLGAMNLQLSAVPALRKTMPFDLNKMVPVCQLTLEGPVLVVRPELPVKSLPELVAYLKSGKGDVTYASSGSASPSHLGMELLLRTVGGAARHIPYQGAAKAATALAGGQVSMALLGSSVVLPLVSGGRMRAIAVSSEHRIDKLPAVATFQEQGFGNIDVQGWVGIVAPAGTPAPVVERMNQAINAALRDPAVRQRMTGVGSQAHGGTAANFATFMHGEMARWQQVVKEAGIEAQ